jgi:hypothetical protein
MWTLTSAAAVLILRRAGGWRQALPVLVLAVSSAKVTRLVGFYTVATVMLLGPRLTVLAPVRLPRVLRVLVACAALVPVFVLGRAQAHCVPIVTSDKPDGFAASALVSAHGRLFVPFNWGEYAIWHFPGLRVSLDGRRETVYSDRAMAAQRDGAAFVAQYQPEYVWMPRPKHDALEANLTQQGYRQDVSTPASFVLTRRDLPPLLAGVPLSACFE